jgi:pentatricopeptide repeat protein
MIGDAVLVFDIMPRQDTISWNYVISGCSSNGLNSEAIELFIRMWTQGHELDLVTLLSVFASLCSHAIGLQEGWFMVTRLKLDWLGKHLLQTGFIVHVANASNFSYQISWYIF